jgi:hypothetical protein
MKSNLSLTLQINPEQIKDHNERPETLKLLEESLGALTSGGMGGAGQGSPEITCRPQHQ